MNKKKRILVIEDQKELSEIIKTRLEAENYEIETACDGEEGLIKAKTWQPDLITLDIMLPKLSGYEICESLKTDAKYRRIPILMLTVLNQPRSRKIGIAVGADDYLTKPYDSKVLFAKIKELLEKSI